MNNQILRLVITGGPCAGKTTAINQIKSYYEKMGYVILTVAETPTEVIKSGVTLSRVGKILFQKSIIKLQIEKEKIILEAAKKLNGKIIILYDRGIIDHFSYTNEKERISIEKALKIEVSNFYNNYNAVFHMKSVARGLPNLYINNDCRKEDVYEASQADDLIHKVWSKHINYYTIDCKKDFNDKINDLIKKIDEYIKNN